MPAPAGRLTLSHRLARHRRFRRLSRLPLRRRRSPPPLRRAATRVGVRPPVPPGGRGGAVAVLAAGHRGVRAALSTSGHRGKKAGAAADTLADLVAAHSTSVRWAQHPTAAGQPTSRAVEDVDPTEAAVAGRGSSVPHPRCRPGRCQVAWSKRGGCGRRRSRVDAGVAARSASRGSPRTRVAVRSANHGSPQVRVVVPLASLGSGLSGRCGRRRRSGCSWVSVSRGCARGSGWRS